MNININTDFHFLENLYYRFKRGLGCCDVMNYNNYISKKIANDLKIFKKKTCGYPMNMEKEGWDNILQEMIDGFESLDKLWKKDDYTEKEENKAYKKRNKAVKLFAKYFGQLWY